MDWVHLHYIKDLKKEKIDTALKNKKSPIRPKALKFLYLRAKILRILARKDGNFNAFGRIGDFLFLKADSIFSFFKSLV